MRTAEQHNSNDDYANVQYSMYDSNDRIIRILDMMAATVILILAALIAYKPVQILNQVLVISGQAKKLLHPR